MKIKRKIESFLKKQKEYSSTHHIAKGVKKPWHSVHERLQQLENEGKVQRSKINKTHMWKSKKSVIKVKKEKFPKAPKETKKVKPKEGPAKESSHEKLLKTHFWRRAKGTSGKSEEAENESFEDPEELLEKPDDEIKSNKVTPLVAKTKLSELRKIASEVKNRRKANLLSEKTKGGYKKYVKAWTYVKGLDIMISEGIPAGSAILVAGGTGSGKTILNLQIMHNALERGLKCLFITLEESEKRLIEHMYDFGWDAEKYINKGQLYIVRLDPFGILRSIDALLAKAQGELYVDVDPVILPPEFKKPDRIFVDSLTAIAAGFVGKEETYRIYIEQFFRYLEDTGATSFLVTETDQVPTRYSPTGTEEFLADGVIVLYNFKKGTKTYRAIEILKLRGTNIKRDIVQFEIVPKIGLVIKPTSKIKIGFGDHFSQ